MRKMISDILASNGMEVVGEADTGSGAVERYMELKPDLVTMDIIMPEMNGIDAPRSLCVARSGNRLSFRMPSPRGPRIS